MKRSSRQPSQAHTTPDRARTEAPTLEIVENANLRYTNPQEEGGLCGGGSLGDLLLRGGDGLLGTLGGVTGVAAELRVDLRLREMELSVSG